MEKVQHHKKIFSSGPVPNLTWFEYFQVVLSEVWEDFCPYRRTLRQACMLNREQLYAINPQFVREAEQIFKQNIYSVFINYYRTGGDYAPYHKDLYGFDVGSISFGETREFHFKHNTTNEITKYTLENRDIFYFPEEMNNNYKHTVPATKKNIGPRINITCFLIKP